MKDIPNYEAYEKIIPITKGMSSDKKYYIETVDSKRLLLRIADITETEQKYAEFEIMKKAAVLGIPMSQPIDFGVCDNGKKVYTLLSWIDGKELESILPFFSKSQQYALGIKSGKILNNIHRITVPDIVDNWATRYFGVIDERIGAYRTEGILFDGSERILGFLESNRYLLEKRSQCRHHGDYHEGNMIISDSGELFVIDWHYVDFDNYGDPWYDFNRIGVTNPSFASGQIDGYFQDKPPEEFWVLFAYYIAASAITSIVWAKYFAPERLSAILQLNTSILNWFDNMKNPIPIWYNSNMRVEAE